jgi:hypothetical protein
MIILMDNNLQNYIIIKDMLLPEFLYLVQYKILENKIK